jgi:pyrroline-5-carboxylate reductase
MTTSNRDIVLSSDLIVVAIRPQHVLEVLGQLETIYAELSKSFVTPKNLRPVIVSVATSVSISQIEGMVRAK